ncbi:MAG: hypothetical protein DME22_07015 [Verrucomicrobia bacterium]|nr:MAG: hypothetical protein DME22_07015 [Verrucomicrobiota bacterium]
MALDPVVMLLYARTLSSVDLRIFRSARLHKREFGIQLPINPVAADGRKSHSISAEGGWSLLTSAAAVQGLDSPTVRFGEFSPAACGTLQTPTTRRWAVPRHCRTH